MTTTTKPGFTARLQGNGAPLIFCRGAHHSDTARAGFCDGCGAHVVKTDSGRLIDLRVGDRREYFWCFDAAHECNAERAAAYAAVRADKIASGELVKGTTVTVVKGRKVALGTTGVVCWIGEDSYGKARVGIRVDGETVFTAAANVEVTA